MHSLAISLGHNASAVYIRDGQIIAGYEEERFTGIKADSCFPHLSIKELDERFRLPTNTHVYVGHWFVDAKLPPANKYWDPKYIQDMFPNGEVHGLSADFTHHDSHLESAMVFAGPDFADTYTAMVADGFGNFGECISIYEVTGQKYRLLHRVYGFEKSMGMLYQYATAYMGMKMHNHEYKMLAYEVHIFEVLEPWELEVLKGLIRETAKDYLQGMSKFKLTSEYDPVTKLDALPAIQMKINNLLAGVIDSLDMHNSTEYDKRVVLSYFTQHVVEAVITSMVAMHGSDNLLVVGGLFYNVKINHLLAQQTKGKFCAMPLAGDQGAALGVYNAYQGDLKWPDHLFWGHRDLYFNLEDLPEGIVVVDNESEAEEVMHTQLNTKGFVNLVRGPMEYGPRALCNTSTIAVPDKTITEQINRMNDRTMEMPMAPVMTQTQADSVFVDCDKIHKSLEYMIVTRAYRPGRAQPMLGAAHFYPEENVYTGRPQITADPLMCQLLNDFGPLVNTSFNYHGVPIVRDEAQILNTHVKEWEAAPDLCPTTVIIRNP